MNRVGAVCLVLSLLAGCVQPVSLKTPLPPVARDTDASASVPEQGNVQVFPLDSSAAMRTLWPPATRRSPPMMPRSNACVVY